MSISRHASTARPLGAGFIRIQNPSFRITEARPKTSLTRDTDRGKPEVYPVQSHPRKDTAESLSVFFIS